MSMSINKIDRALDAAGDRATTSTTFADTALKVAGRAVIGGARTGAMAFGTYKVAEEFYKGAKDMATGATPSTIGAEFGNRMLGGVGEFLAIAAVGYAGYRFGIETVRSGLNAYKSVVEVI